MTSAFDSIFVNSAYPVLENHFGEAAEYLFRGGSVQPLSSAIIDRSPPESVNEKGDVYQPRFTVQVNIEPRLIDIGGDRIRIKEHATDDEFKTYSVYKLLSQIGMVSVVEVV